MWMSAYLVCNFVWGFCIMGKIIGVNKRGLPTEALHGISEQNITVVLVEGSVGDYAAYYGVGNEEYIKDHGNKLSFEEACIHFPGGQLDKEKYRD